MKMGQPIIYGMFDPRDGELRYVGRTARGKERFDEHTRTREMKKRTHLVNWLKSLAGVRPIFATIQELGSVDLLDAAEIYWIAFFKAAGCRLTNITSGGDGARDVVMSQATKDKIAAIHRGMKHSAATLAKMKASGAARDPAAQARIVAAGNARKGKSFATQETRRLMSAARLGKKRPELTAQLYQRWADPIGRAKMMAGRAPTRWVEDQYGATFSSATEAALFHGTDSGSMHRVLTGERPHINGVAFRYVEESS